MPTLEYSNALLRVLIEAYLDRAAELTGGRAHPLHGTLDCQRE